MASATLGLVATLAFQLPAPVPRAPVAARRSGAAQLILGLGEVELLPAEVGERDVGDLEVAGALNGLGAGGHVCFGFLVCANGGRAG